MSFAVHGKNLDEAYDSLQKAVQLDPGTVEIRVDEAQVLMRMNRNHDAADVLDLALRMAHTPEQTAAVETVQQLLKRYSAERAKTHGQNLVIVQNASPKDAAGIASTAKGPAKSGQGDSAIVEARAIYSPQPEYTEEARAAKLQGTCVVSLTVGLDGTTSNVVVVKKLGMGLDEKAADAVRKWKFQPALRYGRPVLTHLTLSLQFKVFGESTEKFFDLSEKAKAGDPAAEYELANAFFEGREIPKDETQGLALLERAAHDGMSQAQFQMGERTYGDGNNPENYVAAYVWYALAQHGGVPQSDEKLTDLEARMTYEQVAEAKKRVAANTP
jgi:TonB family protein